MESIPILEVNHLAVSFIQYDLGLKRRELHPIRSLSLSVPAGKLTAVVGASGSGKSLVAHAIMGLMPYNCSVTGEIRYEGKPLTEVLLKRLRGNEIALVPQGVSHLDPLMKIGDQIRKGKKDDKSKARCMELLARFGLGSETANLYPFELSGGMARRVLIASALMEEPRLVIADEPTPGLDRKTACRVMGHFKEIAQTGAGVLLITHDLELALETADRIMVFYEGEIAEVAAPEDFQKEENLHHPYTKALFRAMPGNGFSTWHKEGGDGP